MTPVLPAWLPTHEERKAAEVARRLQQLAERPYVVVRIAGNAGIDLMRCRRCNGKHSHLTLMCETQPFYGLSDALYAYWRAVGAAGAMRDLSPRQRARLAQLDRALGPADAWPDFAAAHPRTAREHGIGQGRDADYGAVPIGVPEPISLATAQRLLDKINQLARPPLVVHGLVTDGRIGVSAPLSG